MAYCVNGCWTVSNRIGIGTDAPVAALHIIGVHTSGLGIINAISSDSSILNLDSSTADARVRLKYQGGERWFAGMSDTCFAYHIQNGNNSCINLAISYSTGYVGIGTCVPASKLHIQDGQIRIHGAPSDSITGTQGYYIANACNNEAYNWQMSCNFNLGLWTFSATAGGGWGLRGPVITQSGNVGIGTSSPVALDSGGVNLQIKDRSALFQLGAVNSTYLGNNLYYDGTWKRIVSGYGALIRLADDNNGVSFLTTGTAGANSAVTFTSAMNITNAGRVGIGTSSPSTMLQVCGDVSGENAAWVQNTNSAGYGSLRALNNLNCAAVFGVGGSTVGAPYANTGYLYTDANVSFVFSIGTTEKMKITSAGNVGINCSAPTYKLHVNGTFYAAGSSQDYKQSICNYNTDSCMFMKLKPVTYQYKDEYKHLGKELKSETQIGLIAEEVAETYPELAILVNEEANKVVRNVDYEKLSVILLSEVQKLRREVDDLKHKQ